jgi:hypothetical protein
MGEMLAIHFCENCGEYTECMFSASAKNGSCCCCGKSVLGRADLSKVFSRAEDL